MGFSKQPLLLGMHTLCLAGLKQNPEQALCMPLLVDWAFSASAVPDSCYCEVGI
jgi:hypothetical protein